MSDPHPQSDISRRLAAMAELAVGVEQEILRQRDSFAACKAHGLFTAAMYSEGTANRLSAILEKYEQRIWTSNEAKT